MTVGAARPRDNRDELVTSMVAGRIAPPRLHPEAMSIDQEGRTILLPGTGGISLGIHAGDAVSHWIADHLMPGASIEDTDGTPATAGPLHLLSCLGNRVRDASGMPIGIVAGKRGGLAPGAWAPQLVSVEMTDKTASRLCPGDRIIVETRGRGLAFLALPTVLPLNLSPAMLDALPITAKGNGLVCQVRAVVAPEFAGAGLGQDSWIGDIEIAGQPRLAHGIEDLRFGDLIAFAGIDGRTTRYYHPHYLSIGVISHGPGHAPGHGVGVTLILSGPAVQLRPEIAANASLGQLLRQWSEDLDAEAPVRPAGQASGRTSSS